MSCMPNWLTVWAGQRVAVILGGFFMVPAAALLHASAFQNDYFTWTCRVRGASAGTG